ncbi:class I SAM-dependent methyltransferase [Paenibacillus sp. J5C_2022]|uniref:class I SAM-dependent methyltransferase n=1 Tax=Paenibacillus sp. J5C2022 TaxID=2977129 RepID=UPI0021CFE8DD|nr:class I SAM-dependent methyltransferase [Paenibacillus sp. J5C2022]MCU6711177.1 class I SAM-dependent methyltransferase [Paenibacillus sp. J5C2022]
MGFLSILSLAHKWIAERVHPGDTVIDATAGGGVDTLELAKLVGRRGCVYAFDIQQEALDRTSGRLKPLGTEGAAPRLVLLLQDHAAMAEVVEEAHRGEIAAVMFNLGYLPGSDESVITEPGSTLAALQAALSLLRPGGIVTCALYPGHPGGDSEAAIVEEWASKLPQREAQVVQYRQLQRPHAPYLIAIERSRSQGS